MKPDREIRAVIDQLETSLHSPFHVIGRGGATDQIRARADFIMSISDLLTGLKMLWSDGEADAAIHRGITEIEAEVAACIQELQRERPEGCAVLDNGRLTHREVGRTDGLKRRPDRYRRLERSGATRLAYLGGDTYPS